MKKIIFDLDNTLIFWKDEYINKLYDVLSLYNINDEKLANKINYCLDNYEKDINYFSKGIIVKYINDNCNTNFDTKFLSLLLKKQEDLAELTCSKLIDTLEYLSSKYELYVLTNWFTSCQIGRLKKAGIYKYFKDVKGGEGYLKPHKEAFLKLLKEEDFKDSIMIGDNIEIDIKGALNLGMDAILYNYKNKEIKEELKTINKLTDLKEML